MRRRTKNRLRNGAVIATLGACVAAGVIALGPGARAGNPARPLAAAPGLPGITDTAYPIPAGARFVATNGSDHNPGTISAPFKTISHAIAVAAPGTTIVVRGGTYRESLGHVHTRIALQPYPHEQVWVKGSVVLGTGFAPSGGAWVRSGWAPAICHNCYPSGAAQGGNPAAGLPDQVFLDGFPMRQVTSRGAVTSGTFFVDTAHQQLVLGSNPSGHLVEATVQELALQLDTSGAIGTVIRGIGFAHFAAHYNMDIPAMVVANTTGVAFVNDTFAWSASRGLSVLRPGVAVLGNTFIFNGANAVHANAADGIAIVGNRFLYSNEQHFDITPSPWAQTAAVKVTSTANAVVRNNTFNGNACNSLWFDVSSSHMTITGNHIFRGLGHGISVEISTHGVVADNVIAANAWDGIKISGSTNVAVWNNTVVGNGTAQIGVYDDARSNGNAAQRAAGLTWDTAGISVFNNILAGSANTTAPLWNSFDASHPRHLTSGQMFNADDRNVWVRAGASRPSTVASWQLNLSTTTAFSSLSSLRAVTPRERTSVWADNTPLSHVFVNTAADDYRLPATSPARGAGATLPGSVASALGVSVHSAPLGALLRGGAPTSTPPPSQGGGGGSSPPPVPPGVHGTVGFRLAASDGGIFSFGNAAFYGSTGGMHLWQPIVGMTPTVSGRGYWLVARDGGIFSFGDASFFGSMGGRPLNQPIVAMAPTPSGRGYWLVARDGGIFSFGDARYFGSTGAIQLWQPIVGMTPTHSGHGYWLVAADGGTFGFGDARFYGSMGGKPIGGPIVAMRATHTGRGYWMVGANGAVYAFGDARWFGNANDPIATIGMAPTPSGNGYWIADAAGHVQQFGGAPYVGTISVPLAQPVMTMAPTVP